MSATTSIQPGLLLGKGGSSNVYAWKENKAIKLYHSEEKAKMMEREMENTQIARKAGLPVPKVYQTISIGEQKGLVFDKIPGETLWTALQKKPWKLLRLVRKFTDLQVHMHTLQSADMSELKDYFRKKIEEKTALPPELKARAIKKLGELPVASAICHLDYQVENILIHKEDLVLVDWSNACAGDPVADVAYTCMNLYRSKAPVGKSVYQKILIRMGLSYFIRIYLRRYKKKSGRSLHRLKDWLVPMVAMYFQSLSPGEKKVLLQCIAEKNK